MEPSVTTSILKSAVARAHEHTGNARQERLQSLDQTIVRLEEQLKSRPSVPTELQDDYREEIDAVTLENMQLVAKLDQTHAALKRAKSAYKEEVKHNNLLEQRLEELEQRLLGVLRKGK